MSLKELHEKYKFGQSIVTDWRKEEDDLYIENIHVGMIQEYAESDESFLFKLFGGEYHFWCEKKRSWGKGGRPKEIEPKDQFIKVRFSALEKIIVKNKAKNAGLSLSDFVRKAVWGVKVQERLTKEQKQWVMKMNGLILGISKLNNLYVKTHGLDDIVQKNKEIVAEWDKIRNEIYGVDR
jgi:hypothetical protein